MSTISILLHPEINERLLDTISGALEAAVIRYPDTFEKVEGRPNTEDHYGYRDGARSSVILSKEYNSRFYRLRIINVSHPVIRNIAKVVAQELEII